MIPFLSLWNGNKKKLSLLNFIKYFEPCIGDGRKKKKKDLALKITPPFLINYDQRSSLDV